MEASEPRLTLSVNPMSDPITGSIRLPDGSSAEFSGYIELAAALERFRERPAAAAPDARSRLDEADA